MLGECKLVIIKDGVSQDVILPKDRKMIQVGTTDSCDFRVTGDVSVPVELVLTLDSGFWMLTCSKSTYFTVGDSYKLDKKQLLYGDELTIKACGTDEVLFHVAFLADFNDAESRYDRIIDVRGAVRVTIGGSPTANLYIRDPMLGTNCLLLYRNHGHMILKHNVKCRGISFNGQSISNDVEIKDTDFFSLMGYSFYYRSGCLYTDSRCGIRLQGLRSILNGIRSGEAEYPKFVRNVRKKIILSKEPISILDPPQKMQKPKNNIFLQLLPVVGSIILVVLLRGVMGGGGSFVVFSACSMGLGAVTTVITFISGNKDYKRGLAEREQEYNNYIDRKRKEIEQARVQERQQLQRIFCGPKVELQRVRDFSGDLFDRQAGDEDYLRVLIGLGKRESIRPIKISKKEEITVSDDLAKIPRQIAEEYKFIPDAPIYLDCMSDNAVGVVGDEEQLREIMKCMTLDMVSRHYYNDLKLVYMLTAGDFKTVSWIRWLPHVKNDDLELRNIVYDEESKNILFEYLFAELSAREQQKRCWPHCVVFVMADYGIKRHPLSRYISKAKDSGFTFIFFEGREELLPQGCDEVVTLVRAGNSGSIYKTNNLNDNSQFTYTPVSDREMQEMAIMLSPIYSEEISLESGLVKSLTFFEMLDISSPDDIDLDLNWRSSGTERSLAAPLGISTKGIVSLDLHEMREGPHGLVAGTTGSGKSELLQSYVISMAVKYHPYDVAFMIIDFKGGGMANQLRGLPHLLGAITNIDGREVDRSLKSIKAELKRRQVLFAEAGVSKINDYIRLFKKHELITPLPHLIIIVDEFAELKAQQPDFMKELISAARIGRSLGVHLILATQKPSGQVDDQIWSNSRFKLCLKVATSQDSNEMIKSPLAAEIREPGRAYLMIGENESMTLFQSAYSGGPASVESSTEKEFSLFEVDPLGERTPVFIQKRRKDAGEMKTQLDAVVAYIAEHCRKTGLQRLSDICLPPLEECILFRKSESKAPVQTIVAIGIYDDPEGQYQGPAELDLSSGNTFIIGSSQTGKTNLLQTIIEAVAENYSPEEVTMYIIDFNSMILKNFKKLAHVGGVVTASEDEALKNLFKLLLSEITKRKEKLLDAGVSSFISYRESGRIDLPQILLIIDNLTALKELYFQDDDILLGLCRDGPSVGISIIVANSQTAGIGYRYLSAFSNRAALFCHDSGEYSALFEHSKLRPLNVAGRCVIELGKTQYECQTYLAFEGDKEFERVNSMRAFIDRINTRFDGHKLVTGIPVIPEILTEDLMEARYSKSLTRYNIIAGLDYATVGPVILDLTKLGLFAISGRENMGRRNFIRHMLYFLERNREHYPVSVCIADNVQQQLASLKKLDIVSEYTLSAEKTMEIISSWEAELKRRHDALVSGETIGLDKEPLLLLIIHNNDIVAEIGNHRECMAKYKNFFAKYKEMKSLVVYSNMENSPISYGAPESVKILKEKHQLLFFDDLPHMKIFDAPVSMVRQFKKPIEPGDCYLTSEDGIRKIKTVFFGEV